MGLDVTVLQIGHSIVGAANVTNGAHDQTENRLRIRTVDDEGALDS